MTSRRREVEAYLEVMKYSLINLLGSETTDKLVVDLGSQTDIQLKVHAYICFLFKRKLNLSMLHRILCYLNTLVLIFKKL